MPPYKIQPVDSFQNLKERVDRFFKEPPRCPKSRRQLLLDFINPKTCKDQVTGKHKTPASLLDFISNLSPQTEIFLFGGALRDLAIFGKRGFHSDIDIVVEGDWPACSSYIQSLGAQKNKFGGFRLEISGRPIDIWHAKETWAIRKGLIKYKNISSLTETTILNWDAILMNWRTREILCPQGYLSTLQERRMDIVLFENPNPLGAAVRVFRHLCSKDAKSITQATAEYLANSTTTYTLEQLISYEVSSHGCTFIEPAIYELFKEMKTLEELQIQERLIKASENLKKNGKTLSYQQLELEYK